jgi:hypothetical protein
MLEIAPNVIEEALMAVPFDQREGGHQNGVIECDEGFAFEEPVGDGARLLLVHCEETLVKEGLGREFGVHAEESVEEGHLRDIAAEYDDADGERCREDEAGPSPEESPEDGHGEQGERGDARARAEEPGFDQVGRGQAEHKEEADD